MDREDLIETIRKAVHEAVSEALPKQWLSKKDLCREFGIEGTLVWRMINDPVDPLKFTTIGNKKQLFKREDINEYLEKRKRNSFHPPLKKNL